jgi:hypothetical protein
MKKLECLNGAMTLSITTFSMMTISITINTMRHSSQWNPAQWQNVEMLNFIMQKVIMLNVANNPFMLSVVMPGVIRLYTLILSVVAPFKFKWLAFLDPQPLEDSTCLYTACQKQTKHPSFFVEFWHSQNLFLLF